MAILQYASRSRLWEIAVYYLYIINDLQIANKIL